MPASTRINLPAESPYRGDRTTPAILSGAVSQPPREAGPSRLARCLEIEQFLLRAGWGENGCAAWDPAGTPAAAVPVPLLPRQ